MDLWSLVRALARSWWLIAGVALVSTVAARLLLPDAPYQVTIKASVIVAGDTEMPGQAERPELMVLDDLLPLVESPVFAELVHDSLPSPAAEDISTEDVHDALSGSRYSRILSVTVSGSSPERVEAIGDAVNGALPAAVGTYLVAPGDTEPTVRIIDPGGAPEQQFLRRWISIGVVVLFAVFAAVSLIWLREALRVPSQTLPGAHAEAKESFPVKKAAR
jgi:capsular polysaccharide biosynthesis protein